MILEFKVSNEILKKRETPAVVDQNTNYYKCKLYMDKKFWQGSLIYATFMNDVGYIETVQLGEYNKLLSCLVPQRIVQGGFFSLYISDDSNYKTNTISVTLTNHYKKARQKCNVISEIFEQIDTKIDDLVYDNYQIKCYSNGELIDVIYIGNVDEQMVKDWVYDEMTTFRSELSDVAFSGSYNDLVDVPETFKPSEHTHLSEDINDLDEVVGDGDTDNLLSALINEINLI